MKKVMHSLQRGQSLVEFAILIPVFIFIVVLIFDFGRVIYFYSTIHNAAREGARYGIINPGEAYYAAIREKVREYAIGLDIPSGFITVDSGLSDYVGDNKTYEVSVTVDYCFIPVTPLIDIFLPDVADSPCGPRQLLLIGDSVMRTEAKP